MDAIEEVAKMKCSYLEIVEGFELACINGKVSMDGQVNFPHEACQGTGLRWPELSLKCYHIYSGDGLSAWEVPIEECDMCNGSGRISNVDLEKVFDALEQDGYPNADIGEANKAMQAEGDMYQVDIVLPRYPWTHYGGKGATRLEAACNALLDSIKE